MIRALVNTFGSPIHRRRAWTGLATIGAAALPGIGALGYETSLLLAPFFAILGATAAIDAVRRERAAGDKSLIRLGRSIGVELSILNGIALTGLIVFGIFHSDAVRRGIAFYLLGPAVSSFVGATLGLWSGTLFSRRRTQLLGCWLFLVGSLALAVWRLYSYPVVFAFDAFVGYFAGPIYDDDRLLRPAYIWYRVYNLVACLGWIALWRAVLDPTRLRFDLSGVRQAPRRAVCVLLVLTLLSCVVTAKRDELGFHASIDTITEALSATRRTTNFVIHYDPKSATAQEIDAVALEHEFAWHRLEQILGEAPRAPVRSFVFDNSKTKWRLMGAGETEIAAPWRRHIYLTSAPFPAAMLHHELAHVFGACFGDPILGVSFRFPRLNLGMIEGFAGALEDRSIAGLGQHERAAILAKLMWLPPLESLMGIGFLRYPSQRAYNAVGSFCLWIVETRGVGALTELHRNAGDFRQTCQTSLSDLEAEWIAFLGTVPVEPSDVEIWRRFFERGSLFERRHAHEVAALTREMGSAGFLGRSDDVVSKQERICELEPDVPRHRIDLARAYAGAERWDDARRLLEEVARESGLSVDKHSSVAELTGDVLLHQRDFVPASRAYERALTYAMPDSQRRALLLKRLACDDAELAPLVEEYFGVFSPPLPEPLARMHLGVMAMKISLLPKYSALGDYLLGRNELRERDAAAAARFLRKCLEPSVDSDPLPTPEFVREARWLLMSACCQIGEYAKARELLTTLRSNPQNRPGDLASLDRWRERIDFFESSESERSP